MIRIQKANVKKEIPIFFLFILDTFCQIVSSANKTYCNEVEILDGVKSWPINYSARSPFLRLEENEDSVSIQPIPIESSFTQQKASPEHQEVENILAILAVDPMLTTMLDGAVEAKAEYKKSRTETLQSNEILFSKEQSCNFYEINNSGTSSNRISFGDFHDDASITMETFKDNNYWKKRKKNNLAAKRSRAARREREIMNRNEIEKLRNENESLRMEVLFLRKENARLKGCAL